MPSAVSVCSIHRGTGELRRTRFVVNVILVVGHEKLNVEMQRAYSTRMAVVKIPKSGGVSPPLPLPS